MLGHLGDIEVEFSRIKQLVEDPNGAVRVDVEQGGAGPHTSLVLPEAVLAAERAVGRRPQLLDPRRVSDESILHHEILACASLVSSLTRGLSNPQAHHECDI